MELMIWLNHSYRYILYNVVFIQTYHKKHKIMKHYIKNPKNEWKAKITRKCEEKLDINSESLIYKINLLFGY